tara:strand:+ start:26 stop:199 length:174 start_codon:yes stop_codon:yes gene_type:complete
MKNNYSIEEILNAVDELRGIKKDKKIIVNEKKISQKNNLDIPKSTLKLIEEAENSKN